MKKQIKILLLYGLLLLLFPFSVFALTGSIDELQRLFGGEHTLGATVLFPGGGGTGISTAPTAGQLLRGKSTGVYELLATSTDGAVLSLDTNGYPAWIATSSLGISSDFPFTTTTNYGQIVNATNTPLWLQSGVMASTTSFFVNASTTNLGFNGYADFLGISNPTAPPSGTARFHALTMNGFTRFEQDNEATTNLTLSRDNVFIAKNTSGSDMTKGQAVYVSGSTGNVPNIALAKADSLTTLPAVGLLIDDIANDAFGQIMKLGLITSYNTSAFSAADRLFISTTTAGALTNARPIYPNYVQRVGSVLVSGVGNGSMSVSIAPFIGMEESGTNSSLFQFAGNASTTQISASEASYLGTVKSGIWNGTAIGDAYLTKSGDWAGTFDSQEGSYYLNAANLTNFGTPFFSFFSATTTTALTEGNNLYWTNNRFDTRLAATTTLPQLTTLSNLTTVGALTSGSLGAGFTDVPVLQGGTGLSSFTASSLLYSNSDGTALAFAATSTLNIGGNAGTATALASNPADCGANTWATTIAANGDLTCSAITYAGITAMTSANFAGLISDETGTAGKVVFDTSPTLITPILGYASSTQLTTTNSTYLATSGGNVGIGTTGPLQPLQVGALTGVSDGQIVLAKSNSGPNRAFKMGLDASYNFSLGDYGYAGTNTYVPWVTVKYDTGNVGIGTTSPTSLLSVYGDMYNDTLTPNRGGALFVSTDTVGSMLSLEAQAGSGQMWSILSTGSGAGAGAGKFVIYDNVDQRNAVVVDGSGNLGIGTTSPSYKLDVFGNLRLDGTLKIEDTDNITKEIIPVYYSSFTYSTSTAWTATTTIPLGVASRGETWLTAECFTDIGTLNTSFNDGTDRMNLFNASTTVGTISLSTNNSFTAKEKRYVDIGTPASSPTKISCTIGKYY